MLIHIPVTATLMVSNSDQPHIVNGYHCSRGWHLMPGICGPFSRDLSAYTREALFH